MQGCGRLIEKNQVDAEFVDDYIVVIWPIDSNIKNLALRLKDIFVMINKTHCEVFMESAKIIKELRESIKLSRKEFSEHIGIPVRTLEDWEAGRRTPPEYIPRLIAYQLKYEELIRKTSVQDIEDSGEKGE